jgi:biphenyl-2,3-diol 1,2-dioxygenase
MTKPLADRVRGLGYLALGVSDVAAWRDFATNVIGMQETQPSADGAAQFRMDEHARRLLVYGSGEDDVRAIGLEVRDAAELAAVSARLRDGGVEVVPATAEERAARDVADFVRCRDPDGLDVEIYYGPHLEYTAPFRSPRAVSGFVTGDQGLGHAVLFVKDVVAARRFYEEQLGFLVSDFITMRMGRASTELVFLHCNPRHHTIALVPAPVPRRLHHFMVQTRDLDDVGATLYLARERQVPLTAELGRHTNDHMVSFYMRTPSGFELEYGWGARVVDDDTWRVARHTSGSMWGHTRPQA